MTIRAAGVPHQRPCRNERRDRIAGRERFFERFVEHLALVTLALLPLFRRFHLVPLMVLGGRILVVPIHDDIPLGAIVDSRPSEAKLT